MIVATVNVEAFAGRPWDLAMLMHELNKYPGIYVRPKPRDRHTLVYVVDDPSPDGGSI